MEGWIKLHRKLKSWKHYKDPVVKSVFLDLLMDATHTQKWVCGVHLGKGEVLTSITGLEESTGLSRHTIIKALATLCESKEITKRRCKNCTIIKIVNYSNYQCVDSSSSAENALPMEKSSAPNAPLDPQGSAPNALPPHYYLNKNVEREEESAPAPDAVVEKLIQNNGIAFDGFCKSQGIDEATLRKLLTQIITEWQFVGYELGSHESKQRLLHALQFKAADLRRDGQLVGDERERKAKFIAECRELVNKGYKRDEVLRFAEYYTQQERGTKRMLFEAERAWNTETRFKRWNRN